MKKYIFLHFTSLIASLSNGQTPDKTYELDRYLINPSKKTVSVQQEFHEYRDDGLHAWGVRYVPDSTINYDKTTLFVIGNQFVFKEHIPQNWAFLQESDLKTLRIIRIDFEYNTSLCRDKNFLYRNSIGFGGRFGWQFIDLSGYETINDFIYKKNNELYFLTKDFKLKKIGNIKLHIPTLTHVMGNYFTDKNGLYLLGGYHILTQKLILGKQEKADSIYDKSIRLEKIGNKKITPIIKRDYFIYGDKVYASGYFNENKPLPINVEKMKEFEFKNSYSGNQTTFFLADDTHVFAIKIHPWHDFLDNDFFDKNVNEWQVISAGDIGIYKEDDGKTLYFQSGIKQGKPMEYAGILIQKQNEFYTIDTREKGSVQKFNQVFIFNFDTQQYETLDLSQYRYLAENLWIYKNRLYVNGLPTKEKINIENLHFIAHHNIKTNFLTDDQSLIYVGEGEYGTLGEGGNKVSVFGKRIVSEVDFSTLKVITADILTDKDNIYIGNRGKGINVVPIKALELDVKIFTE
ncbi:MAG: hypothetical protein LBE36_01905 [Flavobacteriaceae bacterium]|jgi:hypothetical protein|nr:hypothetical protein [Flavobacteriaceae bacterium]